MHHHHRDCVILLYIQFHIGYCRLKLRVVQSDLTTRPIVSVKSSFFVFLLVHIVVQEMLGNPAKARAIFERWMEWEPEDNAWAAYVKFEMRQEQPANAR